LGDISKLSDETVLIDRAFSRRMTIKARSRSEVSERARGAAANDSYEP
jgi:hypothetical protein